MRSPNLGNVGAYRRQIFVGEEPLAAAGFKSTGVEHGGELAAPTQIRRNLSDPVVIKARVVVAQSRAVHFLRIVEDVREGDKRMAENKFIGQRRAEHVGEADGNGLRFVLAVNRRRVGNLVAVAPPQADRQLLKFLLQLVY